MPSKYARVPHPAAQVIPDYLKRGLDIVFVGINPGLASAAAGHHYAGPTNQFWPLLYEAGFVPDRFTYHDDHRINEYGIGLTNLVARESRGIDDLSLAEMRAGAEILREKLRRYHPRVVGFNGKAIAQVFLGHAIKLGLQPDRWEGIAVFAMPATSARAASYSRAAKLEYFKQLKRIVDKEKGR
jgi:TDG/mug DNA glycosylase family protein